MFETSGPAPQTIVGGLSVSAHLRRALSLSPPEIEEIFFVERRKGGAAMGAPNRDRASGWNDCCATPGVSLGTADSLMSATSTGAARPTGLEGRSPIPASATAIRNSGLPSSASRTQADDNTGGGMPTACRPSGLIASQAATCPRPTSAFSTSSKPPAGEASANSASSMRLIARRAAPGTPLLRPTRTHAIKPPARIQIPYKSRSRYGLCRTAAQWCREESLAGPHEETEAFELSKAPTDAQIPGRASEIQTVSRSPAIQHGAPFSEQGVDFVKAGRTIPERCPELRPCVTFVGCIYTTPARSNGSNGERKAGSETRGAFGGGD